MFRDLLGSRLLSLDSCPLVLLPPGIVCLEVALAGAADRVVAGHDLRLDESSGEVRVEAAGYFHGRSATTNHRLANLVLAAGEEHHLACRIPVVVVCWVASAGTSD